jgi:hypothetical protein
MAFNLSVKFRFFLKHFFFSGFLLKVNSKFLQRRKLISLRFDISAASQVTFGLGIRVTRFGQFSPIANFVFLGHFFENYIGNIKNWAPLFNI